jgi:acetyl-CoA synthetase
MRRILRKIASSEYEGMGDVTTLAEPEVVAKLIEQHRGRPAAG